MFEDAQSWQCYIDVQYKTTNLKCLIRKLFWRVIIASSESICGLDECNTVSLVSAALQSVPESERKKNNRSIRVCSKSAGHLRW